MRYENNSKEIRNLAINFRRKDGGLLPDWVRDGTRLRVVSGPIKVLPADGYEPSSREDFISAARSGVRMASQSRLNIAPARFARRGEVGVVAEGYSERYERPIFTIRFPLIEEDPRERVTALDAQLMRFLARDR